MRYKNNRFITGYIIKYFIYCIMITATTQAPAAEAEEETGETGTCNDYTFEAAELTAKGIDPTAMLLANQAADTATNAVKDQNTKASYVANATVKGISTTVSGYLAYKCDNKVDDCVNSCDAIIKPATTALETAEGTFAESQGKFGPSLNDKQTLESQALTESATALETAREEVTEQTANGIVTVQGVTAAQAAAKNIALTHKAIDKLKSIKGKCKALKSICLMHLMQAGTSAVQATSAAAAVTQLSGNQANKTKPTNAPGFNIPDNAIPSSNCLNCDTPTSIAANAAPADATKNTKTTAQASPTNNTVASDSSDSFDPGSTTNKPWIDDSSKAGGSPNIGLLSGNFNNNEDKLDDEPDLKNKSQNNYSTGSLSGLRSFSGNNRQNRRVASRSYGSSSPRNKKYIAMLNNGLKSKISRNALNSKTQKRNIFEKMSNIIVTYCSQGQKCQ